MHALQALSKVHAFYRLEENKAVVCVLVVSSPANIGGCYYLWQM